ncbi:phosphoribosylanthranilate isomerase [Halobacteroides halobius DSM 5150]|uniref:N-(5'-phosphoribosyl)anthranilate isomerase n=1 Tax=Halobacteroides halobius (strain ATCC 35273 / DSM 5150 / MD-1) TaxID=748449 RepID=L0K8E3_HALHC|nr:phosphoribosylanthranilate isomerase [Halobacteroides halobius]AGB40388.1 phosphoribosylanthranilate isomerase [Halobacteroides halobius DSM 5150]
MSKIKVCGLTNLEDAKQAAEVGADLLGFIFAKSPRQVTNREVAKISKELPAGVKKVGVFANQSKAEIKETITKCDLDYIQLHGSESPKFCKQFRLPVIKAFRVKDKTSLSQLREYEVDKYLLDTYVPDKLGGTGKTFNWELAIQAKKYGSIIMAGGLEASNVKLAVKKVSPWAVDVSSGVEVKPGKKDYEQVKEFVESVESTG